MVEQKKATREPSRERGRARRELLLATAKAMISEDRSLEGLPLQEIAKRAGVPRVSLYYFFPSVEALMETLYSEALLQMTNELAQTPFDSAISWQKLIDTILDETRSHYERNPVTQILALSPLSFTLLNGIHRDYGEALSALLCAHAGLPTSAKLRRGCEIASELADTVWRKSFVETGKVTATLHRQAKAAVLSYLEDVIDRVR